MKSILTLIFICITCLLYGQKTNKYLDAALLAEKWIQSQEINKKDSGICWRNIRDSAISTYDLYSGNSGIILFYLELYHATKKREYLNKAHQGFKYIQLKSSSGLNVPDVGLYTGLAGVAYTAYQMYKITGKKHYTAAVVTLINRLAATNILAGSIANKFANDIISGYAGIGLFYLYADQFLPAKNFLPQAKRAGDILLRRSLPAANGIRWPMFESDTTDGFFMPNFSHGTAGVAYFLATLYERTREKKYLQAAIKGAEHLRYISNDSGWVYHVEPNGKTRFYLGWCHGPVGTSRLYYKLYKITGEKRWEEMVKLSANSIMISGIPEKRTPGFWNNVSQCCGSAGIAEWYLNLNKCYNNTAYISFSKHVLEDILKRATIDESGMSWLQAEHRVLPDLLQAQTGYMQGASGIGIALLHMYEFENKRKPLIKLPDNPF
ncbi:MAG: hypothetical protein ICV66_04960 [Chitinophagaceae bacterium]|nr:hypothetical protein [Chitinophagaceae bacterium]